MKKIDLSYGSGLLAIMSNVNKMKLMKTYLNELPVNIISEEVKKTLIENASSGDEVLLATTFHELKEPQKLFVVSLLKALHGAGSIEELRENMKPIINKMA